MAATGNDAFQRNLHFATDDSANGQIGTWPSGEPRYANQRSNMYKMQKVLSNIDQNTGDVSFYSPVDPTEDPNFYTKYKNVTQSLGQIAKAWKTKGQSLPNVDEETKKVMDRIKLPSYIESISEEKRQEYFNQSKNNPTKAVASLLKDVKDWDENNFYYKLRAAQVLKNQPENTREKLLNEFSRDAYSAKNNLDAVIDKQNKQDAENVKQLAGAISNVSKTVAENFKDAYLRATGRRTTTVDENGVKTTTTISSGPADLDELARRLGENNSFQAGTGYSYVNKDGTLRDTPRELTEEDRKRLSNQSSEDASSNGNSSAATDTKSEDVIEYTYKPGDTFGQVIKNLGLETSKGLWGNDGDVAYYTQQLIDQGVWPDGKAHNIPIGTTIRLKRRK